MVFAAFRLAVAAAAVGEQAMDVLQDRELAAYDTVMFAAAVGVDRKIVVADADAAGYMAFPAVVKVAVVDERMEPAVIGLEPAVDASCNHSLPELSQKKTMTAVPLGTAAALVIVLLVVSEQETADLTTTIVVVSPVYDEGYVRRFRHLAWQLHSSSW
jgi:hypothetical protein